MLQQLNQSDTEIQHDKVTSENSKMTPTTPKRVLPQQLARSGFPIPIPFVLDVITEKQKRTFLADALNFTDILYIIQQTSTF